MWTRSVCDLLQRLVVLPWGLLIHTQRVSVYLGCRLSEPCFVVSHSVLLVYINGAKAWACLWHFQMYFARTRLSLPSLAFSPVIQVVPFCFSVVLLGSKHESKHASLVFLGWRSLHLAQSPPGPYTFPQMRWIYSSSWLNETSQCVCPTSPVQHPGQCHGLTLLKGAV